MLQKIIFLLAFLPLIACSDNPYDTSTPENFVLAMGLISEQSADENPLPFFYDPISAEALTEFDEKGLNAVKSFDNFRNGLAAKFPNNVNENEDGFIELSLDGFSGMDTRSFSYSATQIGGQLKERQPSDYEFVSATEPDAEGVVQLTLKILGSEKTLPIKKTEVGYRMFLTEDVLEQVSNSILMIEQLEQVFSEANQLLESGELTNENFEEELEAIYLKYAKALN